MTNRVTLESSSAHHLDGGVRGSPRPARSDTPEEVQEALYTRPRWITPGRGGTTLVFAMTDAGRYLLVVIAPAHDGGVYVVTARDLNDSERRTFRRKGR